MQQYEGFGPEPLERWLKDRPNPDPILACAQSFANKLIKHRGMRLAWPQLKKIGIGSLHLRALVENAVKNAHADASFQPITEVNKQLDKVKRLIGELRTSIEESPLPKNAGTWMELKSKGLPSVQVIFGWRDMDPCVYWPHHPVSVVDTLDTALMMVEEYKKNQPARAVLRSNKRHEINAFVVNLGWLIRNEFGAYLHGTLAHITNAIYQPADPLGKAEVKGILKGSPEPYLRFKKGGVNKSEEAP